jgi:HlyD family secretion protein
MAKRKGSNKLIFALLGVIILLGAFGVYKQRSKPKGEKVSTEKVEPRTIKEMVAASGKVFPQTEVKISSDVSGEIVELYVEEGDSVIAGQLLAKIDPDAYQSQVERGVAGVNSSKAQLANSKSQIKNLIAQKEQIEAQLINARDIHKRNEKLKKDGVISDQDYDASLSNLKALEANLRSADANIKAAEESANAAGFSVKSAEATLKELRTSLRRTTIYAPTSGIISLLNVEQGERVVGTIQMAGTEMMRIANLNAMEVRVDVSENDIPRVSMNDEVEIEIDAYINRTFIGYVTQIANTATNAATATSLTSDQVTNFEVRISIDPASYKDLITKDKPYPFRPGMSASVEINTDTQDGVLSIPIQAVTTREKDEEEGGDKKFVSQKEDDETSAKDLKEVVFVVSADTVRMAEVITGIQDDTYIRVLSGLSEGEEVVVAPYTAISRKLKEGMEVLVVEEDELYKN